MKIMVSRYRFILYWIPVFLLFCGLGQWQLARYHYKQQLVMAASERLSKKPIDFVQVQSGVVPADVFRRVTFRGEYQNDDVILVQNQFFKHQSGVKILTPVRIPGDPRLLLVDRGWHPLDAPNKVSSVFPVTGLQTLHGYIRPKATYQFILGANIARPDSRPLWIQRVNVAELSRVLKADLYPFIVQLDSGVPGGFVTEMHPHLVLPLPPERHLGYAFQWFAMAGALFLVCLYFAVRPVKGD